MASRSGLHHFWRASRNTRFFTSKPIGRRYQTQDTTLQQQSLASRLWNSPVGLKTVHFWAPVMKWALVLAGVSDFWRPAEKLSLTQNVALTATGAIWTRWCFVIRPQNYLLAAVNFFLGCVGVTQVTRILIHQRSVNAESLVGTVKNDIKDVGVTATEAAKDARQSAKKTVE